MVMKTTEKIKIVLTKGQYTSLGYRTIVEGRLKQDGREKDGDTFFLNTDSCDMEASEKVAKEFSVETVWIEDRIRDGS